MATFNTGISKTTGCNEGGSATGGFNEGISKECQFNVDIEEPVCPTNAEYVIVYNEFTNKPGLTDCERQNDLVESYVNDSLWDTKLDRRFIMAIHTNAGGEAQLDWIDPVNNLPLLSVNGIAASFVAYEGFQGDGINQYFDTQYNPFAGGYKWILNSGACGIYNRTDGAANWYDTGQTPFNLTSAYVIKGTANNSFQRLNSTNTLLIVHAVAADGYWIFTRTASNAQATYKNKTSVGNNAGVSTALANFNFFLSASNNNGTPYQPTGRQYSGAFYGAGYNTTERDNEVDAFETYMDAYGKGVIA